MTLQEIFKGKEHLLEDEAVKGLIKHVTEKHEIMKTKYKEYYDLNFKILSLCSNSEMMVVGGKDAKQTLKEIYDLV